jgi:hypothetical protein
MQDALKQRFTVEWRFDAKQKTKVWRFMEKETLEVHDDGEA